MISPKEKYLVDGIRAVAFFEALKGILVVLAGFAVLQLLHRDLQDFAENIVKHLHLNPARHYPRIFIESLSKVTDTKLKYFAGFAFLYSTVRFVEAYGLWRLKNWAEWFAIISGAIYIPVEIYELIQNPSYLKGGILFLNIIIVLYLIYVKKIMKKNSSVEKLNK